MADGVRLMLDDLARHGSAVLGQRGDQPDQLQRDARRALRRHRLRPLSGFTGSVSAGGGGVARHVAEPGMPEQVVPVGMGGEPGDHRNAEPVQVIGELVQIRTIDAGIDQDQPTLPAHHDGIGPDPRTLPDPDTVGHLSQHRFNLSGISPPAQEESPPAHVARHRRRPPELVAGLLDVAELKQEITPHAWQEMVGLDLLGRHQLLDQIQRRPPARRRGRPPPRG